MRSVFHIVRKYRPAEEVKMSKHRIFIVGALIALLSLSLAATALASGQATPETKAQHDARMAWWREAKFGMFIHWGLYSIPAGIWKGEKEKGIGEWIMFNMKIPVAEYEPLVHEFNPVKFNAAEWVRIAKSAGQKYIVITSKHHDGFALFDSQVSDYDVMATPFQRDIMKELADEAHKQGLKICWYHSILDWHHPDYLPRGAGSPRPWDTRPTEGASFDRYLDYMKSQLRELLTNYGPIGILWFDGGWEHTAQELHSQEVVDMIRSIQPDIIINDRINIPQDYDTPEQYIPATGIPGRDWETCMTMNDTWGYKSWDDNWKSSTDLIRKLVDIVSKGGNFLLNVGPTAEGLIPQPSVDRLADMGRWMNLNSESIYGTTASVFRRLPWGRCTVKPGKLYLHVFDWPADGKLVLPGLQNDLGPAYFLTDLNKEALPVSREGDAVTISLPAKAWDPVDTVIVLEIMGAPEVAPQPIKPQADGSVLLSAIDADIHGSRLRYEEGKDLNCLILWTEPTDSASWFFEVPAAGDYTVEITYSCDKGLAGSRFELIYGDQKLPGKTRDTGAWKNYRTGRLGTLKFEEAGPVTVSLEPVKLAKTALMNLRSVLLRPVEGEGKK
jgi:alpha-L-fucosidase